LIEKFLRIRRVAPEQEIRFAPGVSRGDMFETRAELAPRCLLFHFLRKRTPGQERRGLIAPVTRALSTRLDFDRVDGDATAGG